MAPPGDRAGLGCLGPCSVTWTPEDFIQGWGPQRPGSVSAPVLCFSFLEAPQFCVFLPLQNYLRLFLGTGPSWATRTSKMTSLWGRPLPCPLERSPGRQMFRLDRDARDRSMEVFLGSFLFQQMVVAQRVWSMFSLFYSQNFYHQSYAEWVSQRISFSNMQTSVHIPIPDYKQLQFLRTSPKGPFTRSCSKSNVLLQRIMSFSKIF